MFNLHVLRLQLYFRTVLRDTVWKVSFIIHILFWHSREERKILCLERDFNSLSGGLETQRCAGSNLAQDNESFVVFGSVNGYNQTGKEVTHF
jgi:hypothetical protein